MRAHGKEDDRVEEWSARSRPTGPAATGPLAGLQALQRTAGNAAVSRAIARERQDGQGDGCPTAHDSGAHQEAGAPHIQRVTDEELRAAKNPEEMLAALRKSGHSDDDAWELMRHMTSQQFTAGEGQGEFNILDHIKNASDDKSKPIRKKMAAGLMAKRWTIRHYTGSDPTTPPSFMDIASTYDNAAAGRASEHTNVADWRSLGNIKFTFYLVAVDGRVPPRKWLGNTHWYAEWDLDQISECWVSPDLLEKMNKPMDADGARAAMQGTQAFRGTGQELKEMLAVHSFGKDNDPVTALDNTIGGAFELKVPGGLPVTEWKKK
ncbi:hypothetical protein [Streptomyces sp. NPDC002176]|uniref:hypothetical protein n=1 Tax=Streptomyces sp. NPDC002176 TaxID=3364634 RepID=UPI00384FB04D